MQQTDTEALRDVPTLWALLDKEDGQRCTPLSPRGETPPPPASSTGNRPAGTVSQEGANEKNE